MDRFLSVGSKSMNMAMRSHSIQRSASATCYDDQDSYRTSSRSSMIMRSPRPRPRDKRRSAPQPATMKSTDWQSKLTKLRRKSERKSKKKTNRLGIKRSMSLPATPPLQKGHPGPPTTTPMATTMATDYNGDRFVPLQANSIQEGTEVEIFGLVSANQYNGETGVITGSSDSRTGTVGRWDVHIPKLNKTIAVKQTNLKIKQTNREANQPAVEGTQPPTRKVPKPPTPLITVDPAPLITITDDNSLPVQPEMTVKISDPVDMFAPCSNGQALSPIPGSPPENSGSVLQPPPAYPDGRSSAQSGSEPTSDLPRDTVANHSRKPTE